MSLNLFKNRDTTRILFEILSRLFYKGEAPKNSIISLTGLTHIRGVNCISYLLSIGLIDKRNVITEFGRNTTVYNITPKGKEVKDILEKYYIKINMLVPI